MNDDGTSQRLDGESCARFMRHCRADLEIRLIALVGKKMLFVVYESEQKGFDDIVLEGVGAAAERIMDLTIMEGCKNGTIGDQGYGQSLDGRQDFSVAASL